MRQLVLNCGFALGDVVMFTAAVRDLHRYYPGAFQTDVHTHYPRLWDYNPYLTRVDRGAPGVEIIDCEFPLVSHADEIPYHCLHGFVDFLNKRLGLAMKVSRFHGDIHICDHERELTSKVAELAGEDIPYWIVSGGGKFDITIKWWSSERYQQVVDHFRGRMQFVQIGDDRHWHPPLRDVIDLRGQTSVRDLVRLMHHAQGVLCGVTGIMHLAAAVPVREGRPPHRPCVVVGGGREPSHWEAYGQHQYIHTIGALPCCERGGCWKTRTAPIGDGSERDRPEKLCVDTVGDLPRCMDMITAEEVIRRIETYFANEQNAYLSIEQRPPAARAVELTKSNPFDELPLTVPKAHFALAHTLKAIPPFPDVAEERGIVICASDRRYAANAWVSIRRLRELDCTLPIELWLLARDPESARLREYSQALGVRVIDAKKQARDLALRRLDGWTLQSFALTRSAFRQSLLLDADNYPLADPTPLFSAPEFAETGALFWPDSSTITISEPALRPLGVELRDEPRFETGQILVDRERHWTALHLAHWIAENDDFFHDHLGGDHAFQVAFWKAGKAYSVGTRTPKEPEVGLVHFAPDGGPLFEHRRNCKWTVPDGGGTNGDGKRGDVGQALQEFAAEVWPAVATRRPRFQGSGERRFWHVFFDPQYRAIKSRKIHNFSRSVWVQQYREGRWQPLAVRSTQLRRTSRAADNTPAPYLGDLIAHAAPHADKDDCIVLSSIGVCPAPSLTRRLQAKLDEAGATYAYVRHFPPLARALTDEQVVRGEQSDTCGLFAFRPGWWGEHCSDLADIALDQTTWAEAIRDRIKASSAPADVCLDDAVYVHGDPPSPTPDA